MACIWAAVLKGAIHLPPHYFSAPLTFMAQAGIMINIVLMVLNLLPILPLDGGRILASLLPEPAAISYMRLEPFGFPILLVLLFTNALGLILNPLIGASLMIIDSVFRF